LHCQSFRQGCCGCCVNMRWPDRRVLRYLDANARTGERIAPGGRRPGFRDLVRWHWARGGAWDHLLLVWLVIPTFGLSALIWKRWFASCPFAGYIDRGAHRVGCLIHPRRVGTPDLRRHAFPLVPTAGCDRHLVCPMLRGGDCALDEEHLAVSRRGYASLRTRKKA